MPDVFDFESYKLKKGFRRESWENEREFARNIWNQWFDQVSIFIPLHIFRNHLAILFTITDIFT